MARARSSRPSAVERAADRRKRHQMGDVVLIEGQRGFAQHHLPIAADEGTGHPGAIAPEVFFLFFFVAIGLLAIGALLDSQLAIAIPSWLLIFFEAFFDRDA